MQIIRQSAFKAVPWKNGGGVTHEGIRVPAQGDAFVWRVSVAHIGASGPFSDFAAYRRTMVLLKGDGLRLQFGNGQQRLLQQAGALVEFDGALATHCHLLGGPCVDLNLMVAKTNTVEARVQSLKDSMEISASQSQSTVIFPIDTSLTLDSREGEPVQLEAWDLAVVTNGALEMRRTPRGSEPAAPASVFFATIHV